MMPGMTRTTMTTRKSRNKTMSLTRCVLCCLCLYFSLMLMSVFVPRWTPSSRLTILASRMQTGRSQKVSKSAPHSHTDCSIVLPLPTLFRSAHSGANVRQPRRLFSPSLVSSAYLDSCFSPIRRCPRIALADSVDNFLVPPHFHSSSYDFQEKTV